MQILIGSAHLSHVQVSGREQIEIDSLDRAAAATILAGPYALAMIEQPVTAGIAVIIECNEAIGDIDVTSEESLGRDNSLRMKAGKRRPIKENACKDVAGAGREDTVGQRPPPVRMRLNARLENIHSGLSI